MSRDDEELKTLAAAGFDSFQSEAILWARGMAENGESEQAISEMLQRNGFRAELAAVIVRAALKAQGRAASHPEEPVAPPPRTPASASPRFIPRYPRILALIAILFIGMPALLLLIVALVSSSETPKPKPSLAEATYASIEEAAARAKTMPMPEVFHSETPRALSELSREISDTIAGRPTASPRPILWTEVRSTPAPTPAARRLLSTPDPKMIAAVMALRSSPPKPNLTSIPSAKSYQPTKGGILFDNGDGVPSLGKLMVINGTGRNAICKLINQRTGSKFCSFLVLANGRKGVSSLPDGTYRVIFAFGEAIIYGTDRFEAPDGFTEFKERFEFMTTRTATGQEFSTYEVTLNKVVGGNARTGIIDADEFNKY